MSLKRNIIANYSSQLYITAAGIVLVPLFIRYMGTEAYGLVGFFAMLQAFFNLLDMGLTPTIARESARYRGGGISVMDYRRLARALEGVFAAVAFAGGALLFSLAAPIANLWLNANHLPIEDVTMALRLMAIIIALRWMCGLYRGVITGAEQLVWLSGFNSVIATLRFVLVLPILMFISAAPQAFFTFQLGVALLEISGLCWKAYCLLPAVPQGEQIQWKWAPIKPVLKFSLSIAFTSSVWVLITQTDKLLLSKILPLADYGYFTVAVLLASGIMIIGAPVSSALMPRMARLQAEGEDEKLIALYRRSTRMMTVIAVPLTLVLAFFSKQILWAWTGNAELVTKASTILSLYSIGYGFLVMGAFPYYLQYAKGDVKLHLIGSGIFVSMMIPSIIFSVKAYGMQAAGWAWMISNIIYFFGWTPLVHNRFKRKMHLKWLWTDIGRQTLPALILAIFAAHTISWTSNRVILIIEVLVLGLTIASAMFFIAKSAEKINETN